MIVFPTAPWAHYAGDAAAWIGAALSTRWQHRRWPAATDALSRTTRPGYFLVLALGALLGAWAFGSGNTLRSVLVRPSHSIAGALAGGIFGVELWKWRHGIRHSTGGSFVLPICVGIVIGRFGCLFAGLPDYTYGTATTLPWAVDLGDGIGRHPVELYESLSMAIFLLVYLRARLKGWRWAEAHAFHAMIIVYASQRFLWEFVKPYPTVIGPLNIFHLLMMGLIAYGIVWWRRGDGSEAG
jgi:phosphatidylglycerol---prolipoprotein diacylglyceryl transferase